MQSKRAKFFCLTFFSLIFCCTAFSQLAINGPQCVLAGTEYQYNVSGNTSETNTIQYCITGGTIVGSNTTCVTSNGKSIRVKWHDATSGNLKITSPGGNSTITIIMTKPFNAGTISSGSLIQNIKKNDVPAAIICSGPTGGSCNPKYEYQWEESSNGMTWKKIEGAIAAQLSFSSKQKATMYYRCRVKDSRSNSEALTNTALIVIKDEKKDDPKK